MWRVALYSLPFFLLMVVTLVLIFVFPQIVTILPDTMMRG
jgi:TRAP-type C4-dicarboxylate transport system permease large subunit